MLAVRALIFVAVLFDVLIAISIPPVPGIQFYIVGIDFKNTTNLRYTDAPLSSSFRGQVNSAAESKSVQNLVQLQLGLWATCFTDSLNDTQCLPFALGYTVTLTNQFGTIDIVKSAATSGLPVLALGGALALVALFTAGLPKYHVIVAAVIALHVISIGFEIGLLVSVSKETPGILNQTVHDINASLTLATSAELTALGQVPGQVSAAFGRGFYFTIFSLVALLIGAFVLYASETKKKN